MRRRIFFRLGLAATIAATAFAVYWFRPEPLPETETLAVAQVLRPMGTPNGMVFLFSDAQGFTADDAKAVRAAADGGAIAVGIDLKRTFAKVGSDQDCVYFVSDVEKLSQVIQRAAGVETYLNPIIAGSGAGATMVMALVGQSPLQTIGRAIAVDPGAVLPLDTELCSGAPHSRSADGKGWVYGLEPGKLPEPVSVIETPKADPAGSAHVADLIGQDFAIEAAKVDADRAQALDGALATALSQAPPPASNALADLPLALLPAQPRYDTMAIILSGDGGWRDIDRQLGESLSAAGVPVVGVDSLRYFWTRKSPETVAADLTRIMDHYTGKWGVGHVALIGYSFGADALPAAYEKLQPAQRQRVSLVSLLALSQWATFEFDVGGWLGMVGDTSRQTLPDVRKIPSAIVQCMYGDDDDDSVCDQLAGSGIEIIKTDGDHHFDGDYAALAKRIIARIR